MIDFALFTKEDYKVLLDAFDTTFLQVPLKHPSKALARFVPKGFRVDKLNRSQLINAISDAMFSGVITIRSYVANKVENRLGISGITKFIESKKEDTDYLLGNGIATVSSLLWENDFRIPAYIVFLLFGITPSESCRNESMRIFKTFYEELEKQSKDKYDEGVQYAERKIRNALENEIKRADSLEKKLDVAKDQRDKAIAKIKTANEERDEAFSVAEANAKRIAEKQDTIIRLEKELTQASYDIKLAEEKLVSKQDAELRLAEKQEECADKEDQLAKIKTELSRALELAYTEEVLKHLCSEVLDELAAISIGNKEILRIAKQRFADEETIISGWKNLSEESNVLINEIVEQFSSGTFSAKQLDMLERMEDGILIRYSITKSLKAILYNELEKQESEAIISDRFGRKENV